MTAAMSNETLLSILQEYVLLGMTQFGCDMEGMRSAWGYDPSDDSACTTKGYCNV